MPNKRRFSIVRSVANTSQTSNHLKTTLAISGEMMRLTVLGCYGAELLNRQTCGFLINGAVLVDAGTICSALTLSEQRRIRYILISHIHLDHTKGLAALSDNLQADPPEYPVVLIGLKNVLEGLQRHLLNDQLWPDFTRIPTDRHPIFQMKPIPEAKTIRIADLDITAFSVNHTIPSSGFIIRHQNGSFLYSGDTYRTDQLWQAASQDDDLKAAMIEVSFPNALTELAQKSKHLTPHLFYEAFLKIGKPDLPLYAYHMKPQYLETIRGELEGLKIKNLTLLEDGMSFSF